MIVLADAASNWIRAQGPACIEQVHDAMAPFLYANSAESAALFASTEAIRRSAADVRLLPADPRTPARFPCAPVRAPVESFIAAL